MAASSCAAWITPRSARSPTSVRAWSTRPGTCSSSRTAASTRRRSTFPRFETSGAPIRLSDRIGYGSGFGSFIDRAFSVSSTGRLVFAQGTWQPPMQLIWFDRSGRLIERVDQVAESIGAVLSPDRMRALVERHDPKTNLTGPWVVDFAAGTQARIASNQVESDGTDAALVDR